MSADALSLILPPRRRHNDLQQLKNERRDSGYQFRSGIVTGGWGCGVYVIIQEFIAKQRVNLGAYGNESKKDRYTKGPLGATERE